MAKNPLAVVAKIAKTGFSGFWPNPEIGHFLDFQNLAKSGVWVLAKFSLKSSLKLFKRARQSSKVFKLLKAPNLKIRV